MFFQETDNIAGNGCKQTLAHSVYQGDRKITLIDLKCSPSSGPPRR